MLNETTEGVVDFQIQSPQLHEQPNIFHWWDRLMKHIHDKSEIKFVENKNFLNQKAGTIHQLTKQGGF